VGPATFDTLLIYGRRQKRRQHERPLRTRNAIRSSSTAKRLWHQPRVGSLVPWMELGEARQHTLLWQREVNSAFGPKQRKTVADSDRGSCNRQALRHSRGKNPRSDSKPRMALCRRWAYKSLREGELLSFHQPTACLDMQGWHERAAAGRVVVFNEELDDGRLEWRAATCTSIEATKWPMSKICYDRDHSLTGPLQGGMPGASYRVCELWSRPMSERRVEAEEARGSTFGARPRLPVPCLLKITELAARAAARDALCCCMRAELVAS
jgi:hypothetical protein